MSLKIYTKTGDKGKTCLLGGEKVDKSDLQIEAYGNVDELNSFVGLLQDQSGINSSKKTQLIWIQENLFSLGSILACSTDFKGMKLPEITITQTRQLEKWIDKYEEDLPELTSFILPGGHPRDQCTLDDLSYSGPSIGISDVGDSERAQGPLVDICRYEARG